VPRSSLNSPAAWAKLSNDLTASAVWIWLFTGYNYAALAPNISGFEIILTDARAEYGRSTGGVVPVYQRITRTNLDNFTIPEAPIEKPNLTYILNKVTINGVTIVPQVDYLGSAQFTTDLIGSGFANTAQVALQAGVPGPMEGAAGSRYIEIPVMIDATQRDGSVRRYTGVYTLRRAVVDGATDAQRAWHIASASLHSTGP